MKADKLICSSRSLSHSLPHSLIPRCQSYFCPAVFLICCSLSSLSQVSGVSPGERESQAPGLLLAPGVKWGQTPINQLTPWETEEPPAKQQHRDSEPTGTDTHAYATHEYAMCAHTLLYGTNHGNHSLYCNIFQFKQIIYLK